MSCSNVSLRQLVETYLPERTRSGSSSDYKDLNAVKNKLDGMYIYRNYDYVPTRNLVEASSGRPETICHEHYYTSFTDYLVKTGRDATSKSLGDIFDASQQIPYCTCDGRNISKCPCVYVKTDTPTCDCYTRNAITCTCVSRSSGKYAPSCYCDVRYTSCPCVERSYAYSCDCDGRCSCHTVSEYTMTKKENITEPCDCVSRTYSGECACHVDAKTIYNCYCQNRSFSKYSNAPSGWDSYCGGAHEMPESGRCECNARESSIGNVNCSNVYASPCQDHCISDGSTDSSCSCVTRSGSVLCRCNVRHFYGAEI